MESRVGVRVRFLSWFSFLFFFFFGCPFGGQGFMFFSSFTPQLLGKFYFALFLIIPPRAYIRGELPDLCSKQYIHGKAVQTILEGMGLYQKNVLYSMYKITLCMYVIRCCAPSDK